MAETFESPKKRKRLSLNRLQDVSKTNEVTLGHIQQNANTDPIVSGFVHDVQLRCALVDYRHGRLNLQIVPSFAFVTLADATTTMSMGMSSKDSKLEPIRLPENERCDDALCYGFVELKGHISWSPSKQHNSVPTFIFNRGVIKRVSLGPGLSFLSGKMLPTSDVLPQLCRSRFFETAKFTTPAVVGKIDAICSPDNSSTVMSIEDPVGYIVIELSETKEKFAAENKLMESTSVLLTGPLRLKLLQEDTNAFITAKGSEVSVTVLSEESFRSWVSELCSVPEKDFYGDNPERM